VFGHRLHEAGLLGSMGRVAASVDNPLIESFWSTMQRELLDRHDCDSRARLGDLRVDRRLVQAEPPERPRKPAVSLLTSQECARQFRTARSMPSMTPNRAVALCGAEIRAVGPHSRASALSHGWQPARSTSALARRFGDLRSGQEAPMYVVTAADQRPGPPAIRQAGDRRFLPALPEPVGIQHAVPRLVGTEQIRHAMCGADVGGWVIFHDRPFVTSSGATCQRCAQLAASSAEEG
jgi:hypothetical protein